MKTRIGTNCFCSIERARRYYADYGFTRSEVLEKVEQREIEIGFPLLPKGGKAVLTGEGRYFIERSVRHA